MKECKTCPHYFSNRCALQEFSSEMILVMCKFFKPLYDADLRKIRRLQEVKNLIPFYQNFLN